MAGQLLTIAAKCPDISHISHHERDINECISFVWHEPEGGKANMSDEHTSYRYSPLSDGEIRILEQISPASATRLARYSLKHVRLFDAVYQALSYTWGPPFNTAESMADYEGVERQIEIVSASNEDGRCLAIGRNLYEALEVFFDPETAVEDGFLWADAVCINQGDLEERAAQVAMMASIYHQAKCVFVWLGNGYHDQAEIEWIFATLIPQLFEFRRGKLEPDQYKWTRELDDSKSHLPRLETEDEYLAYLEQAGIDPARGLEALSRLDGLVSTVRWFQRLWVTQEVMTAQYVRVQLGRKRFEWHELCIASSVIKHGLAFVSLVWYTRGKPFIQGTLSLIEVLRRDYQSLISNNTVSSDTRGVPGIGPFFVFLLRMTKDMQVTVPRDKLFFCHGMLSKILASQDRSRISLPETSYVESTNEVYLRFASFLVQSAGLSQLYFMLLGRPLGKRVGLPSWVPDFANPHDLMMTNPQVYLDLVHESYPIRPLVDQSTLVIHAQRLGTLKKVVTLNELGRLNPEAQFQPAELMDGYRRLLDSMLDLIEGMHSPYLTGENRMLAFTRVLFNWQSGDIEVDSVISSMELFQWMLYTCTSNYDQADKYRYEVMLQLWSEAARSNDQLIQYSIPRTNFPFSDPGVENPPAIITYFYDRRHEFIGGWDYLCTRTPLNSLFLTDNGLIGLCDRSCKVTDEVWAIPHVSHPYVFRQTEEADSFELVSQVDCYGIDVSKIFSEPGQHVEEVRLV